jgi:hypothetical protein
MKHVGAALQTETVAMVFYPESAGLLPAVLEWQARNPDWRLPLDTEIICPVCGIAVRAIADCALLDPAAIEAEIAQYRDVHLRSACSDHFRPTEEEWAVMASRAR